MKQLLATAAREMNLRALLPHVRIKRWILPTVCIGFAVLNACHTEALDTAKPNYGFMYGGPEIAHLPGDTITYPVWVTTLQDATNSEGSTLTGVPVDFTVSDPSMLKIVGPSHISTQQLDITRQAFAAVTIVVLKEGTATIDANVAGAVSSSTVYGSRPIEHSETIKAFRPSRIDFAPSNPAVIELRATSLPVYPSLVSSTGALIQTDNYYNWTCVQGLTVAVFKDGVGCNTTTINSYFLPKQVGTATFRVALPDKLNARFPISTDFQIIVTNNVAKIDLSAPTLSVGSTAQVTPAFRDAAGALLPANIQNYDLGKPLVQTLFWTSSDLSVATVDNNGVVTGLAADSVTITAKYAQSDNSFNPPALATGSIRIKVGPTTNTVNIAPSDFSMVVGATRTLGATVKDLTGKDVTGVVTWLSRDVSIAAPQSANANPVQLLALSTGPTTTTPSATVQILARGGGAQGVVNVTVYRKVATINVTPSTATLRVGQHVSVVPTLLDGSGNVVPLSATTVDWLAQDAGTATVDAQGNVTAVAANATPARIRVSEPGGASAVANITVLPAASNVTLAIATGTTTRAVNSSEPLTVGTTSQLVATLKDAATGATINDALTFTTTSSSIATVTSTGANTATITGAAAGTATIRVSRTSDPSVFATATYVVTGGTVTTGGTVVRLVITTTPANGTTALGGNVTFVATPLDAAGLPASDCQSVGWATDDSNVAGILQTGVATGFGIGTTPVRATCRDHNNIFAASRIIVTGM